MIGRRVKLSFHSFAIWNLIVEQIIDGVVSSLQYFPSCSEENIQITHFQPYHVISSDLLRYDFSDSIAM